MSQLTPLTENNTAITRASFHGDFATSALSRRPLIDKPTVYHDLDHDEVVALTQHTNTITATIDSTRRTITDAIVEIGSALSQAQAILAGKGREGLFRPWFTECCGLSRSTVYRAIAAHKVFGKCPTVGHFDAKAIYLLSSDSCPEEAAQEAIQLAENGEYIDYVRAKNIQARYVGDSNGDDGQDGNGDDGQDGDHEDPQEKQQAPPKPAGGDGEVADTDSSVLPAIIQNVNNGEDHAQAADAGNVGKKPSAATTVVTGDESLQQDTTVDELIALIEAFAFAHLDQCPALLCALQESQNRIATTLKDLALAGQAVETEPITLIVLKGRQLEVQKYHGTWRFRPPGDTGWGHAGRESAAAIEEHMQALNK